MTAFLWFIAGFLSGIFFLVLIATYGVMRAKSKLGLDVLSMVAPTKLKGEIENARNTEEKVSENEGKAAGEGTISGVSGEGDNSDPETSLPGGEKETGSSGRETSGKERTPEQTGTPEKRVLCESNNSNKPKEESTEKRTLRSVEEDNLKA